VESRIGGYRSLNAQERPPFIVPSADVPEETHRYPNSDEDMAPARPRARSAARPDRAASGSTL